LYGLPEKFGQLAPEAIIESMYHDKKAVAGKIKYVLPEVIGRVKIVSDISHDILQNVLSKQV
jgi:3-dehydroquinate synthase